MHGRVKVRTTEEERERRKKEQLLKVKAYRAAMTKIVAKRERSELDDEMLQLMVPILQRNPDVSVLWNIRKECVLLKAEKLKQEEEKEEGPKPDTEQEEGKKKPSKLDSMFDKELDLTENCLNVNPKSYGAWHHRCWTLEHQPNANWLREVQLCNKYLKIDERNFHTWNYRRYVVQKAGVKPQDELDYCTQKIQANFSNYSSWHYRSKLLPILYPYEGSAVPKRPMSEKKLKEELEMVLSAAFTDPNDSSAWFYQRWLLGYSRPELDVCAFRCDKEKAVLAFTKPLVKTKDLKITLCLNSDNEESVCALTEWRSLSGAEADTTWLANMKLDSNEQLASDTLSYKLTIDIPEMPSKTVPLTAKNDSFFYVLPPNRSLAYTKDVLNELENQLESCNSLLEYEPDSKWTLLTSALLMRAIDHEKYHQMALAHLEKLQKVDELREGYYKDLASKWILEKLLTDWATSDDIPQVLRLTSIPQLQAIVYPQYLTISDDVELSAELQTKYSKDGKLSFKTFKRISL